MCSRRKNQELGLFVDRISLEQDKKKKVTIFEGLSLSFIASFNFAQFLAERATWHCDRLLALSSIVTEMDTLGLAGLGLLSASRQAITIVPSVFARYDFPDHMQHMFIEFYSGDRNLGWENCYWCAWTA